MMSGVWIRLVKGVLGQALFSCRFVVQWLVSEREGRRVVGWADGVFICFRNLYFIWRAQQSAANG